MAANAKLGADIFHYCVARRGFRIYGNRRSGRGDGENFVLFVPDPFLGVISRGTDKKSLKSQIF